jgi:ABC-type glycerol-3-phosphate transport system permease component
MLAVLYSLLAVVAALALVPFLWGVSTSLKPVPQIYSFPPVLIPGPITLEHYLRADEFGLLLGLKNSTIVATGTVLLTITVSSLAAYSLARLHFRGARVFMVVMLVTMMVPELVNVVPVYIIMSRIGLRDTYWALIIMHSVISLPLATWVIKAFFETVPTEIEDAAMIDGCTRVQALVRVMLPLAQPGIATAALLTFVTSWNEFILAVTLISSQQLRTLPVAIYSSLGEWFVEWGPLTATATIAILPVVALFVVLQRRFISGLTAGAVNL